MHACNQWITPSMSARLLSKISARKVTRTPDGRQGHDARVRAQLFRQHVPPGSNAAFGGLVVMVKSGVVDVSGAGVSFPQKHCVDVDAGKGVAVRKG